MPLYRASANGCEHVARLLIEKGADVNARNKNGQKPLSIARLRGYNSMATLLIKNGAISE